MVRSRAATVSLSLHSVFEELHANPGSECDF